MMEKICLHSETQSRCHPFIFNNFLVPLHILKKLTGTHTHTKYTRKSYHIIFKSFYIHGCLVVDLHSLQKWPTERKRERMMTSIDVILFSVSRLLAISLSLSRMRNAHNVIMNQLLNLLHVGNLVTISISVLNSFSVVCLNMRFE